MPLVAAIDIGTASARAGIFDARGRLLATIPLGRTSVIDSRLPMAAPPTLFSRGGNLIPLLLGFALLIAAIALGAGGRYRRST